MQEYNYYIGINKLGVIRVLTSITNGGLSHKLGVIRVLTSIINGGLSQMLSN